MHYPQKKKIEFIRPTRYGIPRIISSAQLGTISSVNITCLAICNGSVTCPNTAIGLPSNVLRLTLACCKAGLRSGGSFIM